MAKTIIPDATPEMISKCRKADGGIDLEKLKALAVGGEVEGTAPHRLDPVEIDEAGVPDMLRDLTLNTQPHRIRLLQQLESVFIQGEGEAIMAMDVAEALYILAADMPQLAPLLTCAQLDSNIKYYETQDQDLYSGVLADLVGKRALAYAQWQESAFEFMEVSCESPEEAAEAIQNALLTRMQVNQGSSNISDNSSEMFDYMQSTDMVNELRAKRKKDKQAREKQEQTNGN